MTPDTFRLGDPVVAVDSSGRIMRQMQVSRIALRYFETSDGTKWRAELGGLARRVPEAVGAPTLRHRRASDMALMQAYDAREAVEQYRAPVTGVGVRQVIRAARVLGVGA